MVEDDALKYRKKKKQSSKSEKRSKHKHEYVDVIVMHTNQYNSSMRSFRWGSRCRICGRTGKDNIDHERDNLLKNAKYQNSNIWFAPDMYLTYSEIRKKYPNIAIYGNYPFNSFTDINLTERFGDHLPGDPT